LATTNQNIFITKKEKTTCQKCKKNISKGDYFVSESEKTKGTCFSCSPFGTYFFLPPGDAAMTRRSKKHSEQCAVLQEWNQRRRRYERKGQYIEALAFEKARLECDEDKGIRAIQNQKAAITREKQDKIYIEEFATVIRSFYPNCPKGRETNIAQHACEKYSGRVGRSASAKEFDEKMVDLAVEAHIRHSETNYDLQFGKGKAKREIRADVKFDIIKIMQSWKKTSINH
jgi:hypothetical protein